MGHYLDTLAEYVAGTDSAQLPPSTVRAAKDVFLDTIGAMVAGSALPENASLARQVANGPGAHCVTLIGHGLTADPLLASLVNATAGVALEVDEGNRYGGGHPAIHVLPGLLAVAEESAASGAEVLAALVAGYEVTSRLGGATKPRQNVHSHGHWGAPGTAAAVARLKGLDAPAIRSVISMAASMSPANTWTPCFEGATVRNLYPGRSSLQGILATHLHACGFTALEDGPTDVYGAILGETFDPVAVVDGLGAGYRIEQNYFKFHACCRYNHPTLDAVHALRLRQEIAPEEIDRVHVTTVPFPAGMVGAYPANPLAARFSIPYAVAAALVHGETGTGAFQPQAIEAQQARALAGKVQVSMDSTMSMRRDDGETARVAVRLTDGRELVETAGAIWGDAANPAPRERLRQKFLTLTTPVLGAARAQAVVEQVERLDELRDLRELTRLLGGNGAEAAP